MAKVKIKKQIKTFTDDDLDHLSKEELVARLRSLHAENIQLKNIIAKSDQPQRAYERKTKPYDFTKSPSRHILLKVMYLGWDYNGFATQDDTTNTIENHLFRALIKCCFIPDRKSSNYHRCGRTDKGVSAFGQVISLNVRSKLSKENQGNLDREINYCKILNRVLPDHIRCIGWCPTEENFSARFDCKERTYKYFFPRGKLNIEKMKEASNYLLGPHDFRNFCKMDVGNGVVEFIRNIFQATIEPCFVAKTQDDESTCYVITIVGRAFLWHQIRCIMGVLFLIGQNKEEPNVIIDLLDVEANPRKPDYNMASEIPLILYECIYKDDLKWQYDQESLKLVIEKLRELWSFASVKANMMKKMLQDLEHLHTSTDKLNVNNELEGYKCFTEFLIDGVRSKTYVPLMKRPRCKSLEDKIEHYSKRNKIEISHIESEGDGTIMSIE